MAYLERLFEVNTARIKNDFVDRVSESRRLLEHGVRERLRGLAHSAERALEDARQVRATGAAAVTARIDLVLNLCAAVERLREA